MLIIDHVWMFVIHTVLAVDVRVIAGQILMGVFDRRLVMGWAPDHDADHQRTTCHDSEPNKRRSEADVRTQPSRQWVGNQPASMG